MKFITSLAFQDPTHACAVARVADECGWDGVMVSDLHTLEELRQIGARIRAYRIEYGRADEPLQIVAACSDDFDVDGFRRMEDVGVTHLQTMPWFLYGGSSDSLPDKLDGLRRFSDQIITKMR